MINFPTNLANTSPVLNANVLCLYCSMKDGKNVAKNPQNGTVHSSLYFLNEIRFDLLSMPTINVMLF